MRALVAGGARNQRRSLLERLECRTIAGGRERVA